MALIIGIVIAAIVGWIVLSYVLSRKADPRRSGAGFIMRGIEKRGVSPKGIPISLLDDQVEESIFQAGIKSGVTWENKQHRGLWNRAFLKELDTSSMLIAEYIQNPSSELFCSKRGGDYFAKKFKEHGL